MSESAEWLTEAEAAKHCRCSLWAFRRMGLAANDAGGRKVYHRRSLDAALMNRPWRPSTSAAKPTISTGRQTASSSGGLSGRLKSERLRPYAPRKRQNSQG